MSWDCFSLTLVSGVLHRFLEAKWFVLIFPSLSGVYFDNFVALTHTVTQERLTIESNKEKQNKKHEYIYIYIYIYMDKSALADTQTYRIYSCKKKKRKMEREKQHLQGQKLLTDDYLKLKIRSHKYWN